MKKCIFFFVISQFTLNAFSQNLDLKVLINAYNSKSVKSAFDILKKATEFGDKTFLTNHLGDSSIIVYFGQDSLTARRQSGKIIIHCSSFHDETQFLNLKRQATNTLQMVETTKVESMGVLRDHIVYGKSKSIKAGDLSIILTKCFEKEKSLAYFQFDLFPY